MNGSIFALTCRNIGKGKNCFTCLVSGKLSASKLGYISSASITTKAKKEPNPNMIPPFPYKEKDYGLLRSWYDRTSNRFDENSKIIVVDGPIAVGKTQFAEQLANELGMHFVPEANMDTVHINSYGFDVRSLDKDLPQKLKSTDEKTFCTELRNPAIFQFEMFELRTSMYIDALAHVMNTGQGVVMVRSVFSDMVFAEAMAKTNYIRKQVLSGYHTIRNELLPELLRPHVQIYLDIPVPTVLKRIKARGHPWETSSTVLTHAYLQAIEDAYKRKYLPQIEKHAVLFMYDWSEVGDVELVIEDLERIDFDKFTEYDTQTADWRFFKEQVLADYRRTYTNAGSKYELMNTFSIPLLDCPELYMSGEERDIYEFVVLESRGNKYRKGYNAEAGDTGILFKTKTDKPQYPWNTR